MSACVLFLRKIQEKHGAVADRIKLYKDKPNEKNILLDHNITLKDAGFQGSSGGEIRHAVFYDFSVSDKASCVFGDNLLCVEPREYLIKKYEERHEQKEAEARLQKLGYLPDWRKKESTRLHSSEKREVKTQSP